jgi:hypothetical protein
MVIIVLTTSHDQFRQVSRLVGSLYDYASNITQLKLRFVVVESFLQPSCYATLKDSCLDVFASFQVVTVHRNSFWTSSVFDGLSAIADSLSCQQDSSLARIVLMNSDVLPSAWDFLLYPASQLETLVTLSNQKVVKHSGFRLASPFIALHKYPFLGQSCPESGWYCKTVPTRLVVFPLSSLQTLLKLSFLKSFLPHYSADFVLTAFLSTKLSTLWRVRVDSFLAEDTSTSGIKSFNRLTVANSLAYFFGRKSVFNVFDALLFPVLFALLALPWYCTLSYVLSSWSKYVLRVARLVSMSMLASLRRDTSK